MNHATPEIVRILDESLPLEFQRGILTLCHASYTETEDDLLPEFAHPQVHDLRGHYRRAKVESHLSNFAYRFKGIKASSEQNSTHNSYHVRIDAPRLVLTISAVETPNTMVRVAQFRQTYSYQMGLWDEGKLEHATDDIYGIILHGPADNDPAKLGFVVIAFPNSTCTRYIERIDLRKKFLDLDRSLASTSQEIIANEPKVIFLPDIRKKEE